MTVQVLPNGLGSVTSCGVKSNSTVRFQSILKTQDVFLRRHLSLFSELSFFSMLLFFLLFCLHCCDLWLLPLYPFSMFLHGSVCHSPPLPSLISFRAAWEISRNLLPLFPTCHWQSGSKSIQSTDHTGTRCDHLVMLTSTYEPLSSTRKRSRVLPFTFPVPLNQALFFFIH